MKPIDHGLQLGEIAVRSPFAPLSNSSAAHSLMQRRRQRRKRDRRIGGRQMTNNLDGASRTPVASPTVFEETGTGVVLSNGNRDAAFPGSANRSGTGHIKTANSHYFEAVLLSDITGECEVGLATGSGALNTLVSLTSTGIAYRQDGTVYANSVELEAALPIWGVGDVISLAYNADSGDISWWVNGTFATTHTITPNSHRPGISSPVTDTVQLDGGQDLTYNAPAGVAQGWSNSSTS